ncbi:MAG: flavodoxin family protein [Synergistaceae bacterium]|jgi:multimeric flavodoxin WrbA|nr:flavodoxin family protein [Synergistaceae bacterium]
MKVAALNGSPNRDGNTALALSHMADSLREDGIETEIIQIGGQVFHGCAACGHCRTSEEHMCAFKEDAFVHAVRGMRTADGIILGAPAYYAGIPGDMKSFLDRAFFSSSSYFRYKVGTVVAIARRAGAVNTASQLMNFLNLAETITPPSQYWMAAYGMEKGEVMSDEEGLQTIRKNAQAMAWLLKIIDAGKGMIPAPNEARRERRVFTNFIR